MICFEKKKKRERKDRACTQTECWRGLLFYHDGCQWFSCPEQSDQWTFITALNLRIIFWWKLPPQSLLRVFFSLSTNQNSSSKIKKQLLKREGFLIIRPTHTHARAHTPPAFMTAVLHLLPLAVKKKKNTPCRVTLNM